MRLVKRTEREDLPQQDAVRPDITFKGVHTLEDALRGHPLNRETCLHREHLIKNIPYLTP